MKDLSLVLRCGSEDNRTVFRIQERTESIEIINSFYSVQRPGSSPKRLVLALHLTEGDCSEVDVDFNEWVQRIDGGVDYQEAEIFLKELRDQHIPRRPNCFEGMVGYFEEVGSRGNTQLKFYSEGPVNGGNRRES